MSTSNWLFKPREISRAIKAAKSAGLDVRNFEVTRDGLIRINVAHNASEHHGREPQQTDLPTQSVGSSR
jgi:hypothetical protein